MIHVCPLSKLNSTLAQSGARWMISLAGPGKAPERPAQIDRGYLSLEFNDIAHPQSGLIEPRETHIASLIDFARRWIDSDEPDDLIVHCWMGVSRSTAAALIVQAINISGQDIGSLADELRRLSPMATPNPLMIEHADRLLGLDNRLSGALTRIGRGQDCFEGAPFSWETAA